VPNTWSRTMTTERGKNGGRSAGRESLARVRRASTRRTTVAITALSLATAGVLGGGLAVQMAGGRDPALGDGGTAAAKAQGSASMAPQRSRPQEATPTPAPAPVETRAS
jgi:hypothetical protein